MSVKLRVEATYPASVDAVSGVFTDEAFQQDKVRRTSEGRSAASVVQQGQQTVVRGERTLSTSFFPEVARNLVGSTITIAETQIWEPPRADGSRRAELAIEVHGVPVHLKGSVMLTPRGDSTHQVVDADLKCSIPFIGGKIEQAAAGPIKDGIEYETRMIHEQLG